MVNECLLVVADAAEDLEDCGYLVLRYILLVAGRVDGL